MQQLQLEAAWTSTKWALQRAEIAGCHPSATQYIRDSIIVKLHDGPEAIAYAAVRACIDSEAALIITISQTGRPAGCHQNFCILGHCVGLWPRPSEHGGLLALAWGKQQRVMRVKPA